VASGKRVIDGSKVKRGLGVHPPFIGLCPQVLNLRQCYVSVLDERSADLAGNEVVVGETEEEGVVDASLEPADLAQDAVDGD
jgi:hypothetical protein